MNRIKTVGIVGGLGPETTAKFYMQLINKFSRESRMSRPSIVIYNVPIPLKLEEDIIMNSVNQEKLLPILLDGIERVVAAGADFAVIPCNTAHVLIDELRKHSLVPMLSIVEETAKEIKKCKIRRAGILATSTTMRQKLFDNILSDNGVELIKPDAEDQNKISRIIVDILTGKVDDKIKNELIGIAKKLVCKGSEAVILGCTDLPLILNKENVGTKLFDTNKILANATANKLLSDVELDKRHR